MLGSIINSGDYQKAIQLMSVVVSVLNTDTSKEGMADRMAVSQFADMRSCTEESSTYWYLLYLLIESS